MIDISNIRDHMAANGIVTDSEIVIDGNLHRFNCGTCNGSKLSGWLVFYTSKDVTAGAYGCWKCLGDTQINYCSKELTSLSKEERDRFNKQIAESKEKHTQERLLLQQDAANRALDIYSKAKPATSQHHYLVKKSVDTAKGLRIADDGRLAIPLYDECKKIVSLQFISSDGQKRFLSGGKINNCCFVIGKPKQRLFIAEGLATALSLRAATGDCVVVAFNCGNLKSVAERIKKSISKCEIVIAADNDRFTESNPGLTAAKEIEHSLEIKFVYPQFPISDKSGTDFNDLHNLIGLNEVKIQIENQLSNHAEQASPPSLSVDDEILVIAKLSPAEYAQQKKVLANKLKMTIGDLDKLVKNVRKKHTDDTSPQIVNDPDPWHETVDADELLSDLAEAFRRYAILPTDADIALALWCAFTWFCDSSYIAPLLVVRSPEKGCGKSTVMNVVSRLVRRPLLMSGTSAAVLYRVVDKHKPTVLIDEGDTFLNKENEELHGIINSGYSKTAPYHWRCVGESSEPKAFNVFSPKAIALIGHTRETLHDRAIEVELRRKLPSEKIARLRHADGAELSILAKKLARFALDRLDDYATTSPIIPETLPDRQADNWEPLLMVATLAGNEWVTKALQAALVLTGRKAESSQASVGVELLTDIQSIFESKKLDRISTIALIELLCKDEEAAWSTYNRGKSISPRQVSNRLAEYGIKPKTIRFDFKLQKGYEKNQFEDAFARYVLPPILSVTPLQSNKINDLGVTDEKSVTVTNGLSVTNNAADIETVTAVTVTDELCVTKKPSTDKDCYAVTDCYGKNDLPSAISNFEII